MDPLPDKDSYSTAEIAKLLGVNQTKVGILIRSGELNAINTALSLGGVRPRYRILRRDFEDFLERRSTASAKQAEKPHRRRREDARHIPRYV